MPWYCVCSAGGNGMVEEREEDPTPEEAIYWTGPYALEEEAILVCYGVECPQGWWCLCGRIPTEGRSKIEYHHVSPENVCYTVYIGPHNTKGQATTACIDPETEEAITCKTQITNIAYDICKPDSTYSNPVTLECSLACTPIGYPMKSGVMFLTFLSESCASYDTPVSIWFKNRIVSIGLGCTKNEPPPDGIWVGYHVMDVGAPRCDDGTLSIPGHGLTLRFQVTMTVLTSNSLQVAINMERLVPGSEYDPPLADNQWVACTSGSGVAYRQLNPGDDINDRTINWNFVSDQIPFVMGSPCASDVKSISVFIQLQPWRFACGRYHVGLSGEGCGVPVGNFTHSCMTVSARPLDIGNYDPRFQGPFWGQLGINEVGCGVSSGPCGCGVGTLPEVIHPTTEDPTTNLLLVGCPGEINGAYQNYQLNARGGYDVLVKTINRGSICVAIRTGGQGQPWVIAGTGTSTYEVTQTDTHWYARITVPSLLGKPEINLYALRFPNPIINGCIVDLPDLPDIWPPPPSGGGSGGDGGVIDSGPDPSLIRYNDNIFSYVLWDDTVQGIQGVTLPQAKQRTIPPEIKLQMAEVKRRFELRCIYLGAEKSNTGCCGTSNLFQCGKHGVCRRYGRPKANEVVCSGCEDFTEATDAS